MQLVTSHGLPEYPVVDSFELPHDYQKVWDDILTSNFHASDRSEVLIMFGGLREYDFIGESWPRMQRDFKSFKRRLIAGAHVSLGLQASMAQVALKNPGWAEWQILAENTPYQARWAIPNLGQTNRVAVYAQREHVVRAVMSLVAAAELFGWQGHIYPYPRDEVAGVVQLAGYAATRTEAQLALMEQQAWVTHSTSTPEKPVTDVAGPDLWAKYRPY